MLTVTKNQTTALKIQLNQDKLNEEESVVINFTSPSRTSIQLTKSLTVISSGFYSFNITSEDALPFEDDTYSYTITQDGIILNTGFVRYVIGEFAAGLVFDFTLDFTLS